MHHANNNHNNHMKEGWKSSLLRASSHSSSYFCWIVLSFFLIPQCIPVGSSKVNWIIIAPKVVIPVVASVIINKIMLIALVLSSIAKVRVCCNIHKKRQK